MTESRDATAGTYGEIVAWDQDELHEYLYARSWDTALPTLLFVMLNPASGENASGAVDVTTKRCAGYARREGCGGVCFVNLFTLRTTYPIELWQSVQRNGPRADEVLAAAFADCGGRAVVGWGSWGKQAAERIAVVKRLASDAGVELLCVRRNADGSPAHPSRGAYAPLQRWPG